MFLNQNHENLIVYHSFSQDNGLVHANLYVQAHSEIVLVLLAKCDLYKDQDAVKSLVSVGMIYSYIREKLFSEDF